MDGHVQCVVVDGTETKVKVKRLPVQEEAKRRHEQSDMESGEGRSETTALVKR